MTGMDGWIGRLELLQVDSVPASRRLHSRTLVRIEPLWDDARVIIHNSVTALLFSVKREPRRGILIDLWEQVEGDRVRMWRIALPTFVCVP